MGDNSPATWYPPSVANTDKTRHEFKVFPIIIAVSILVIVALVCLSIWLWRRRHQQGQHEGTGPAAPAVGLTSEEIEMFVISVYAPTLSEGTSSGTGTETDLMCAICHGLYESGQQIWTLTCAHSYHVQCIDEWLSSHRTCPDCRQIYPM